MGYRSQMRKRIERKQCPKDQHRCDEICDDSMGLLASYRATYSQNQIPMMPQHGYVNNCNNSADSIRWLDSWPIRRNFERQSKWAVFGRVYECFNPDTENPFSQVSMRTLANKTQEMKTDCERKGNSVYLPKGKKYVPCIGGMRRGFFGRTSPTNVSWAFTTVSKIKQENQSYVGGYLILSSTPLKTCRKADRSKFHAWYEERKSEPFNFQEEMLLYCRYVTIASACMASYRAHHIPETKIAMMPQHGYVNIATTVLIPSRVSLRGPIATEFRYDGSKWAYTIRYFPFRNDGKLLFPLCKTCCIEINKRPVSIGDEDRPSLGQGDGRGEDYEVYHFKESSTDLSDRTLTPSSRLNKKLPVGQQNALQKEDKAAYITAYQENEGIQLKPRTYCPKSWPKKMWVTDVSFQRKKNSLILNFDMMNRLVREFDQDTTVDLVNPSKICRDPKRRIVYNREEVKKYRIVYTKESYRMITRRFPLGIRG
ncbi:hypothetical protein JTE90_025322 [Oedothorax gibbosus]|uniref:Uncharacterized protein n=1 Tax=Oedothorax gibbosus TaxID=931172 RepID=A0AAV6V860_9ARAC|nr:hypothetical protein JTE90_025322 [Oedothorax gibbosus]